MTSLLEGPGDLADHGGRIGLDAFGSEVQREDPVGHQLVVPIRRAILSTTASAALSTVKSVAMPERVRRAGNAVLARGGEPFSPRNPPQGQVRGRAEVPELVGVDH